MLIMHAVYSFYWIFIASVMSMSHVELIYVLVFLWFSWFNVMCMLFYDKIKSIIVYIMIVVITATVLSLIF